MHAQRRGLPQPARRLLAEALAGDAVARGAYEGLAFSHRKEYAQWIAEAKREETRERRVGKSLTMLREGVKHP